MTKASAKSQPQAHAQLSTQLLRKLEQDRKRAEIRSIDLRRDMVELNVLRAFGAAVNDGLDRARIVAAVKDHVPRLFRYDTLTLLLDLDRPEMFVFPRAALPAAVVRHAITIVLDASRAMRGVVLREQDVAIQVDGAPRGSNADATADTAESHVTLPLVSGGQHLGFISVAAAEPNAFGPLDLQLLSLISHQLSAAFRNAALLVETRELAIRDALTGLFNRRHFDERIEEEHRRAARYKHPISLILADIDHFKSINDRFGHPVGDRVIKEVTAALVEGTRSSDILCRYGGEEFAIILPETSIEEASLVAERIRSLIALRDFDEVGEPVRLSFGVAGSPSKGPPPALDALIRLADGALYLAKQSGRNRVCMSLPDGVVDNELAPKGSEKRRQPRVDAKVPVRYMVIPDLGETSPVGRSVDISPNGLRVTVERPVADGAFILLELDDPGSKDGVRLLSKVVWSTPTASGGATLGTRVVAVDGEARYAAMLSGRQRRNPKRARRTPKPHAQRRAR